MRAQPRQHHRGTVLSDYYHRRSQPICRRGQVACPCPAQRALSCHQARPNCAEHGRRDRAARLHARAVPGARASCRRDACRRQTPPTPAANSAAASASSEPTTGARSCILRRLATAARENRRAGSWPQQLARALVARRGARRAAACGAPEQGQNPTRPGVSQAGPHICCCNNRAGRLRHAPVVGSESVTRSKAASSAMSREKALCEAAFCGDVTAARAALKNANPNCGADGVRRGNGRCRPASAARAAPARFPWGGVGELTHDAVWSPDESQGHTALSLAAWRGHDKIVQLLLENNASTEATNRVRRPHVTAAARCVGDVWHGYCLRASVGRSSPARRAAAALRAHDLHDVLGARTVRRRRHDPWGCNLLPLPNFPLVTEAALCLSR